MRHSIVPPVWRQRAFRAWLVVALPLSLVFAWLATAAHLEAVSANEAARVWLERLDDHARRGVPKGTFSADPFTEVLSARERMREHESERDGYAIACAFLILLAPAAALIARLASWIWVIPSTGKGNDAGTLAATQASDSSDGGAAAPERLRWRWPWPWRTTVLVVSCIAMAIVFALVSDKTRSVLISTLIQVAGLSVIAWLLNKFRK